MTSALYRQDTRKSVIFPLPALLMPAGTLFTEGGYHGSYQGYKKSICDETFAQLAKVKEKIVALRDSLDRKYPGETRILGVYDRHLGELADQIDWKLQIMSHSCAYDWEGSAEFGETVSVGPSEKSEEDFTPDISEGSRGKAE